MELSLIEQAKVDEVKAFLQKALGTRYVVEDTGLDHDTRNIGFAIRSDSETKWLGLTRTLVSNYPSEEIIGRLAQAGWQAALAEVPQGKLALLKTDGFATVDGPK